MAKLDIKFDITEVDTNAQREYSELPDGIYRLEIEATDVKKTNAGDGTILAYTSVVIEPEQFAGRKLFGNLNLENPNPKAQAIGQEQFSMLCRAVGLDSNPDDSEELHFKAFTVKLGLGKPSTGKDGTAYPARAEIKRYYFEDQGDVPEPGIDANQPTKAAPANDNRAPVKTATAATKPADAGKARPWGKK